MQRINSRCGARVRRVRLKRNGVQAFAMRFRQKKAPPRKARGGLPFSMPKFESMAMPDLGIGGLDLQQLHEKRVPIMIAVGVCFLVLGVSSLTGRNGAANSVYGSQFVFNNETFAAPGPSQPPLPPRPCPPPRPRSMLPATITANRALETLPRNGTVMMLIRGQTFRHWPEPVTPLCQKRPHR